MSSGNRSWLVSNFARQLVGGAVAWLVCVVVAQVACAQAFWEQQADSRIEQYRKADLAISVVDSIGSPVPGADVHVAMKEHTFGFGTAVTAGWINNNSPNGQIYREKLLENFNHVVFENDLKWPAWEGLWGGGFNWPNTEQALDWLDANELPARGHYLSWATWDGVSAHAGNENIFTLEARLFNHMEEIASTVGNRVYEWDVINHPVGWLNDTYENRMESAGLYDEGLDFYTAIVNKSREAAPDDMPMWINEDDVIAGDSRAFDYERIIDHLMAGGGEIDGIGFQGHFIEEWGRVSGTPAWALYDRIDRFADKGVPLRVTEFDIDVGNNDALQGELMHDYLKVMFSHPAMEAVTLWGFWGGSHWRDEAGALYEEDWDEKPSLTAYQNLVFDQWWTDELGLSDESGQHLLRAFKGEYDITVSYEGEEYVLNDFVLDGDDNLQVELDLLIAPEPDADFNGDAVVDGGDFLLWQRNLGQNGQSDNSRGDANGDGTVDAFDLAAWQSQFGNRTPPAAPIPEPGATALLLLVLGTGNAFARARRHSLFARR